MKLLAVFLAFVVFTGSQASVQSDEAPRQPLEWLRGNLQEFTEKFSELPELIRNSKLVQELNTHITNGTNGVKKELQKQIPVKVQTLPRKFMAEAQKLTLQKLMGHLQPYSDGLNQNLQAGISALHEHLPLSGEEVWKLVNATPLRLSVQNMEDLQPSVEDLMSKLEQGIQGVQQSGQALFQGIQGFAQQIVSTYAEDAQQHFTEFTENAHSRLSEFWSSFNTYESLA